MSKTEHTSNNGHPHNAAVDIAFIRAAMERGEWDRADGERMIAELRRESAAQAAPAACV